MKMTTLGITKEEMIYQFIISLNKGGYASDVYAEEVVETAIGEYDALVEKDIIKEIAYVEPGKPTDDPHVRVCKSPAGDFNTRMYNVTTHPVSFEDGVDYIGEKYFGCDTREWK